VSENFMVELLFELKLPSIWHTLLKRLVEIEVEWKL
jgi:hypothetical protein